MWPPTVSARSDDDPLGRAEAWPPGAGTPLLSVLKDMRPNTDSLRQQNTATPGPVDIHPVLEKQQSLLERCLAASSNDPCALLLFTNGL